MLRRLRTDESGISLTEVMVAGAMASIIATAFLLVFSSFSRGVALEEDRATALREVQAASANLAAELRQAIPLNSSAAAIAFLESSGSSAEIVFYSDRAADAPGPERYRYYLSGCSGSLCELMREVTVADSATPPWTFTGSPGTRRVVANVLTDGDPLFLGADWGTGSEVLTTSCSTPSTCGFSLVQFVLRVDPDPNITAEEPLHVRHEVRMRNAP